MNNDVIHVGSVVAKRGTTCFGEIPIPDSYTAEIKPPPVVIVNGSNEGPVVYVGAGSHGDELNSIEATRRVAVSLDARTVHGSVIFVPIHNKIGFENRNRLTPADGKDLGKCFPGNLNGTATEVLAQVIFHEAVIKSNYVLDLHTSTRGGWNLSHSDIAPYTREASVKAQEIATSFGVKAIVKLEPPMAGQHLGESMGWNLDNSLFAQASLRGIPSVVIEFGEGGRLEPDQVEVGVGGIMNVLASLGVVENEVAKLPPPFVAREAIAIRCKKEGILYMAVRPGELVRNGQLVARLVSFPDQVEEIHSISNGIVIRVATEGLLMPNDRVVVVGVQ